MLFSEVRDQHIQTWRCAEHLHHDFLSCRQPPDVQASAVMFLMLATDNLLQAADSLESAVINAVENDTSGGVAIA